MEISQKQKIEKKTIYIYIYIVFLYHPGGLVHLEFIFVRWPRSKLAPHNVLGHDVIGLSPTTMWNTKTWLRLADTACLRLRTQWPRSSTFNYVVAMGGHWSFDRVGDYPGMLGLWKADAATGQMHNALVLIRRYSLAPRVVRIENIFNPDKTSLRWPCLTFKIVWVDGPTSEGFKLTDSDFEGFIVSSDATAVISCPARTRFECVLDTIFALGHVEPFKQQHYTFLAGTCTRSLKYYGQGIKQCEIWQVFARFDIKSYFNGFNYKQWVSMELVFRDLPITVRHQMMKFLRADLAMCSRFFRNLNVLGDWSEIGSGFAGNFQVGVGTRVFLLSLSDVWPSHTRVGYQYVLSFGR